MKPNRISRQFKLKKKLLMPYLTAGDPSLAVTEKLIVELAARGAGAIELGVPFSDPIADGPVIQASHSRALKNKNVNLSSIFQLVTAVRKRVDIPIVLMSSINLIEQYSPDRFFASAARTGVDGVIIPDLPVEESSPYLQSSRRHQIPIIFLVAPTSGRHRARLIAKRSRGFIYLVSVKGTTGIRSRVGGDIETMVSAIRGFSSLPIAVGFGISNRQHVRTVFQYADGAIVGSALVKVIEHHLFRRHLVRKAGDFLASLR